MSKDKRERQGERLTEAHETFRRWFGKEYDLAGLDVILAAAAVEQLDGDPLWVLLISGSGNAKTETVQALERVATVTSSINSEGALLSGTSQRDRAENATGGLLRSLGDRGVLVLKDMTSVLSMNRDRRAPVMSALRDVYDGWWTREMGVDGGRTLTWTGRIVIVGACTTAWDTHHEVVAAMGDRFVLLRMDSTVGRREAARQAIANTGSEKAMRDELATAVVRVLTAVDRAPVHLSSEEVDRLVDAANLVTQARTGVDRDHGSNPTYAHAAEMPTRFAKQLAQVVRGGVSIGMSRTAAMRLAVRCARDSVLPIRMEILTDVADHPCSTVAAVQRRIDKPRMTVDRQLQALHLLELLSESSRGYSLAEDVDLDVLRPECPKKSPTRKPTKGTHAPPSTRGDISGNPDAERHLRTEFAEGRRIG